MQKEVIGRANEHMRVQRVFREALITSLLESSPRPTALDVKVHKHSVLIPANQEAIRAQHHVLTGGLKQRACYFCRYKASKDKVQKDEIKKSRRGCLICKLPFCKFCFHPYHKL